MPYIKPKLSNEDFEGGDNPNFGKIVPGGQTYDMVIGKHTSIRTSEKGNTYLNIQLNHTGTFKGSQPAFAKLMVEGFKEDGSPLSTKKLGLFLSSLGLTKDDREDVEFDGDEKTLSIMVRGDPIDLVGTPVRALLEVETYEGNKRNIVAFIVPQTN